MKKRLVRPRLGKGRIKFLKRLENEVGDKITKENVNEFASYATKGKLTLANFIAFINGCDRSSKIFRRATEIHGRAMVGKGISNPEYKAMFREAHDSETSIGKATYARLCWSDKEENKKVIQEILGEGSISK